MSKSIDTNKILSLLQQAKVEFNKGRNGNLNHLSNLIKELKILLIHLPSISISSKEIDLTELIIARDVFELSILTSVIMENQIGFERDFLNLQRYYIDYQTILPKSENQDMIKGLYLLFLLSCDKIGEFHMSLENISVEDQESKYIIYVKELEHYLMDGNYSRIMQLKDSLPTPNYKLFFEHLVNTCREKVARCIECSYDKIGIEKLKNMMRFSTNEELISFINKISPTSNNMDDTGISNIQWKLIDNAVYFESKDTPNLSNLDLISNTLGYAIELERIV